MEVFVTDRALGVIETVVSAQGSSRGSVLLKNRIRK